MKRILIIFILFTAFLSCKKEKSKESNENNLIENKYKEASLKNDNSLNIKSESLNENCEDLLKKIIKSSNLQSPFLKSIEVKVESAEASILTIQLFIKTPEGQNQETTVGWIILDAENKKLLDITNDIDNPEILSFNTTLWNQIIKCFFDNKNQYLIDNKKQTNESKLDWNCTDRGGDMNNGYVTNCLTKSILSISYSQLKMAYFEDGNLLLNILPKKDTVYTKENVEINYKILNTKKININLSYGGGVTKFSLMEVNGKTNIIKTLFPD